MAPPLPHHLPGVLLQELPSRNRSQEEVRGTSVPPEAPLIKAPQPLGRGLSLIASVTGANRGLSLPLAVLCPLPGTSCALCQKKIHDYEVGGPRQT